MPFIPLGQRVLFPLDSDVTSHLRPQVHPRLHLILGHPGSHPGDGARHIFRFHPERDAATPHVASLRSSGSWPQLGGNLLGGHAHLHLVSASGGVNES